jgi:predicted house-cleaning noncanonical NTP pyrophosphatase (MazG superfamily)
MSLKIFDKYDHLIEATISKNNRDLYDALNTFMKELNTVPSHFDSQVPTALVLTSSESASSIDTQFDSLRQELMAKVNAKVITLDEKKCNTTKSCVEHLVRQVYTAFGSEQRLQQKREERKEERVGAGAANGGKKDGDERHMIPDKLQKELEEFSEGEEQRDEDDVMENEEDYVNDWVEPPRDSYDPRNTSNYVSTIRNPSFGLNTSEIVLNQSI